MNNEENKRGSNEGFDIRKLLWDQEMMAGESGPKEVDFTPIARMTYNCYESYLKVGFNKEQAMYLTVKFMSDMAGAAREMMKRDD